MKYSTTNLRRTDWIYHIKSIWNCIYIRLLLQRATASGRYEVPCSAAIQDNNKTRRKEQQRELHQKCPSLFFLQSQPVPSMKFHQREDAAVQNIWTQLVRVEFTQFIQSRLEIMPPLLEKSLVSWLQNKQHHSLFDNVKSWIDKWAWPTNYRHVSIQANGNQLGKDDIALILWPFVL